jgi:predicted TIM-barrel fold metal-dependent hydrolase
MLERHPGLQVLMPHVGGILPYLSGRIDYQTETMGRARDHITKPPSAYLKDIYFDIVSPSSQALQYAYEFSGAEKLLFGTDHPWVEPRVFVELLDEMDIPEEEKALIFAGNALSLFNLE